MLINEYSKIGKDNITTSRSKLTDIIGEDGVKDIVTNVLLGGNVREKTEFIVQRRLLVSYASMLELFIKHLSNLSSMKEYSDTVTNELKSQSNKPSRTFYLWLLGLTGKGLDNIVRGDENIDDYNESFTFSMEESIDFFNEQFGELSGKIKIDGQDLELNWEILSLLLLTIGSQTLTIRGSAKSTNGKMFEKLVLGSLLYALGFTYYSEPPTPQEINTNQAGFYLSHMAEHERETDATVFFNEKAISIDIGFIGKGNPEISLDKVTRFGSYKNIGGINHDMSTIVIVDTVAENSDIFQKARDVRAFIIQMKDKNWTQQFSSLLESTLGIDDTLKDLEVGDFQDHFTTKLDSFNMKRLFEEIEEEDPS